MTFNSMPLHGAMVSPLLSLSPTRISSKASVDFTHEDPKPMLYRTKPSHRNDIVTTINRIQRVLKEEIGRENSKRREITSMHKILFIYNFRGDLNIKFMDSFNKMIYQTPSASFMRVSECGTSVDIQV